MADSIGEELSALEAIFKLTDSLEQGKGGEHTKAAVAGGLLIGGMILLAAARKDLTDKMDLAQEASRFVGYGLDAVEAVRNGEVPNNEGFN